MSLFDDKGPYSHVTFDELDEDEIKDTQEYSEVNQIFSELDESEKIYLSLHL